MSDNLWDYMRKNHKTGGWFRVDNDESLKERQISYRQKEAERRNSTFNPEDYKKTDELYFLAKGTEYIYQTDDNIELYTISEGKNKGFIAYKDKPDRLYIENMGSTGGNLGRKLLTHVADKAIQREKGLSWMALSSSLGYYSHVGLDEYRIDNSTTFSVKASQLKDFRKRLNP